MLSTVLAVLVGRKPQQAGNGLIFILTIQHFLGQTFIIDIQHFMPNGSPSDCIRQASSKEKALICLHIRAFFVKIIP
jgi:cytochrome bd-type quinol oxidase subunit 2